MLLHLEEISTILSTSPIPGPPPLTVRSFLLAKTNITFPTPYNNLVAEIYQTSNIAFRFSTDDGPPSSVYLSGVQVQPSTAQDLGIVIAYTTSS